MKDIYGNELEIGDFIIYNKLVDNYSIETYRGKVLEVSENSVRLQLEGLWGSGSSEPVVHGNVIKVSALKEI